MLTVSGVYLYGIWDTVVNESIPATERPARLDAIYPPSPNNNVVLDIVTENV